MQFGLAFAKQTEYGHIDAALYNKGSLYRICRSKWCYIEL